MLVGNDVAILGQRYCVSDCSKKWIPWLEMKNWQT